MPPKKTYKLYRVFVPDPIGRTISYVYFTSVSRANSTQIKLDRKFGTSNAIEEIHFSPSKKGICELLNKLK